MPKQLAFATDCIGTFDKIVLSRTVSLQLDQMRLDRYSDGLVNDNVCPELVALLRVASASIANVLVLDGAAVHVVDIILVGEKPTSVKCCCSAQVNGDAHLGVLADSLSFQKRLSFVGTFVAAVRHVASCIVQQGA